MHDQRQGFSLVEVLVVMGCISVLLGLLIPAVQQSRSAARRVSCQNNLHQIGSSLQSFASDYGTFPTSNRPKSGLLRLFPYLEQDALFKVIESKSDSRISRRVSVLLCPDDGIAFDESEIQGGSNYLFNEGTVLGVPNGFTHYTMVRDLKPSEVSDGLSNTAAMSERLARPRDGSRWDLHQLKKDSRRFLWWTEKRFILPGEEAAAILQAKSHRTTLVPQMFVEFVNRDFDLFTGYDHFLPPNSEGSFNGPEDMDVLNVSWEAMLIPPTSHHSGGVNVLFGDGSVRFVADDINAEIWQAHGSRNGGESAGDL
jgi:prepilin-type processing-associated H-X9-DG protein/prepilin-type N-terminal cleavage/methylation domain-containing protein